MRNIQPFIWLNEQAVEAANFYQSAFKNAKKLGEMPGPGGKPMGVTLDLAGTSFILFNGGPTYKPNASISFYAMCETDEQVAALWNAFSQDGKVLMELGAYPWSERYGWVEDKFGISWQVGLTGRPQRVVATLLFSGAQQGNAEAAVKLYTSLFPNSGIDRVARYEEGEPGPKGQIKHAGFKLNDQIFAAMDSGRPMDVPFTPGISLFVNCETQDEVDQLWEELSSDGHKDRCGWLQDKYGVSWQIVPTALGRLLGDSNRQKAGNVMQAMLGMSKLVIKDLEAAAA